MYSNCLFEAIKAKLKNPKNVHIFKLPKEINKVTHFMWCDDNYYYHAYNYKKTRNHVFFDCKIKKVPRHIFESFILTHIEWKNVEYKNKVMEKCFMKLNDYHSEWDWSLIEYKHDELPTDDYLEFFRKTIKCEPMFKICINNKLTVCLLEEAKSKTYDFEYKLVDLYDHDFERVYRGHKKAILTDIQD